MAEDLADYLKELGIKVQYLHSEVDTLERVAILRDLRLGVYDVLVGINLLREGLDLPEVTLVAILDADKEGFLRSAWSLIQMIGRAARNTGGEVVMYADRVTESMRVAIDETDRRRAVQERYNVEHGIEPTTIIKGIHDINDRLRAVAENTVDVHLGAAGPAAGRGRQGRGGAPRRPHGGRDEGRRQAARVRAGGRDPGRDPADPAAGPGAGRIGRGRAGGGAGGEGRAAAGQGARGGPPAGWQGRPPTTRHGVRGHRGHGAPGGRGAGDRRARTRPGTATELFPGIRDEHEDEDGGWQARWLDRPTWDRTVTPEHPQAHRAAAGSTYAGLLRSHGRGTTGGSQPASRRG